MFTVTTMLSKFTGHKTIVNTVAFHPHFLHVVTSGVEKSIHLHSPTPSSPCTQNLSLSPLDVRQLDERDDQADRQIYLNALMGARTIARDNDDSNNNNDNDDDDDSDDASERETISFFDQSVFFFSSCLFMRLSPLEKFVADLEVEFSLLREEGQTDVFLSRRWWCLEPSSEEETESDEEEDVDDDDEDSSNLYLT